MSNGGTIPYHLRQNKAIERNLFIDLLSRLGRYRNISDYTYIGFGGPYLEDFKHIHAALRIGRMISLEGDANVRRRQLFNQPVSCIDPRHQTSGEFLDDYDFAQECIVWFDYTRPSDLATQLAETEQLVAKLSPGDVFKVTLNASPATLGNPNDKMDLRTFRLEVALKRLGDYAPADVSADDVTAANYPRLLLRAVQSATKRGVAGASKLFVQPLTSFTYKDGQQMVTATGTVLTNGERTPFMAHTRLDHWRFRNFEWNEPTSISVPDLSAKERLMIESMLPEKDADTILASFPYYIGDDADEAKQLMSNFVEYYRMYPWFSKIVI